MNNARAIAEIDAIAARLQALKEELVSEDVSSPWCTQSEYATYARVHTDTVRNWILEGMPATDVRKDGEGKVVGTKKTTRINRQEADAWRASR